ncbi:MAG: DNA primase [Bacteroidales bacterium]|nr:DNA primase [Bacteroidales bacterium]
MINKETIDRIMDATHIEEVVGEFVSLKKRGTNHIGCCPFHNEKTPSFYVSPSKGIFKCFGCGKSGNAVGFLMDHEHYTYPEALRYLAKKYNIEIEEEQLTEEQKVRQNERDGLYHVSEFAQKYFADLLYNDEMGSAIGLSYFHQRGLSDEIIKSFGLGYCLDEWSNFTNHARKNGYSDTVLEKTGLTIFKEDGKSYDRFRGRVMFPIYSISGRVLGFSGRVLSKEKQAAKYVNSPDSDIYSKSHILYGLYQAKHAIDKAKKCYLVEGNVDVVSMHQSGVCNTVASCGTSLTVEQIRLIKRYTPNVTVLYDGDKAGINAAIKAVNLLFGEGMHVRVVLFPDGEDPDSYAQKYGSTQLQTYLQEHEENFVKFKTRVLLEDVQNDPIRKTEVLKEIVSTIALVPDLIERQEYITETAYKLRMTEQVLMQELNKALVANAQRAWKEENQRQTQAATVTESQPAPVPGGDVPPPLEPNPEDYGTQPVGPQYVAPPQVLPPLRPSEVEERQLIKLLVNYGGKEVEVEVEDEENGKQKVLISIAAAIVDDVVADDLHFDNPVYQQIFDLYRDAVEQERPMPDANTFAMHPDNMLRNSALEMMINAYSVSKLWMENKHISVPSIEQHIKTDMEESIYLFKLRKVDQLIEENKFKLREAKEDEEVTLLMHTCQQLTQVRKQLCDRLNRVMS